MAYRMTPARRAALKKAQAASARKRRGKGKKPISRKRKIIGAGMYAAGIGLMAYGTYKHEKIVRSDIRRIKARGNIAVRELTTSPIIRESRKIAAGGSTKYSTAVLRRGVTQRESVRATLRRQTRRRRRR